MIYAQNAGLSHSRAIYNFLDFLGDVGGLYDAFKLIAAMLISVLGRDGLSLWLIGKLFYSSTSVESGGARRPSSLSQE